MPLPYNVKVVRARLKELLPAYVPGLLAENVYSYKPRTFRSKTPASVVSGVRRRRGQRGKLTIFLTVTLYALYKDTAANWDEGDAADQIDDMESGMFTLIEASQNNGTWISLNYAGDSVEDDVELDGGYYRFIDIPLEIGV